MHNETTNEFLSVPLSGITRLPVLEGEVSHVEIPRTSQSLGVTIVGGADTPLVSETDQQREGRMLPNKRPPILFLKGQQKNKLVDERASERTSDASGAAGKRAKEMVE